MSPFPSAAILFLTAVLGGGPADQARGPSVPAESTLPLRRLADGVYAVLGDTGRGSEGRPNAGFVVTSEGVVVVDALASPAEGRRLLRTIRSVTRAPLRALVLTHHHPDHHFGASVLVREGADVVAHPDAEVLAGAAGPEALVREWTQVVGAEAMRGFAYANRPARAVTGVDTLRYGGRTVVVRHPGPAHTPGDLFVWLPEERVLFAGDVLVEDGVTMVVDGDSRALLGALALIDSLRPAIVVPGHGAIPAAPTSLVARTRAYVRELRDAMRREVERGTPLNRALAAFPPADEARPVSLDSRRRRNAVRVYLEMEREAAGFEP
ncbi:MAG TPA: MBL fold metallo-hydrolase [Gemmatimonadales bacterium]|nr:MBL fold metallo-hydrolase [Gemmatimonadales bacterium]